MRFPELNHAYNETFRAGELSLGLVVPIESYPDSPVPTLERHVERAQLAEELGFASLWLRDVPFHVPSFGDAGQLFDPFAYLGYLAAKTDRIALGVASVILPLRHPAHVAKAAASVDVLSGGRLLLGVASGDRPAEYPAMGVDFETRGERFRESVAYIERMPEAFPAFENALGAAQGMDLLPKPSASTIPLLITGGSQQAPDWIAAHGQGWMTYPRPLPLQERVLADWRARVEAAGAPPKPVVQPLYVDLLDDPNAIPQPIHLGMRTGSGALRSYLRALLQIGVNHVALNLRFQSGSVERALERLATDVLPDFTFASDALAS